MIFNGEPKGFSCPMIFTSAQSGIMRAECIGSKCAWWERFWRVPVQGSRTTKVWHEIDIITHGGLPEGAVIVGGQCGACKGMSASKG
jgi:hypothetical protein